MTGMVHMIQRNTIVREIIIKCGLVYEGKNFKNFVNKVYYPGEIIFKNIKIERLSLCQHIVEKQKDQLLIRPLSIYEVPKIKTLQTLLNQTLDLKSILNLKPSNQYLYKCTQKIKTATHLNLITNILDLDRKNSTKSNTDVQFSMYPKTTSIEFLIKENLYLPN